MPTTPNMWSTPKRARDLAARMLPSIKDLVVVRSDSAMGEFVGSDDCSEGLEKSEVGDDC